MAIGLPAMAQGPYESLSINTNNGAIDPVVPGGGITRPAFGCFKTIGKPVATASSVIVTNGTITSGSVTNTRVKDNSYLVVQESGQWKIDFTFQNGAGIPHAVDLTGYYDGNPSHNVKMQAWDFTNKTWTNLTTATRDIPNGTVNTDYTWPFPSPETNFIGSGIVSVRVDHTSSAIGANLMYIDYIDVLKAAANLASQNVWYAIGPVNYCELLNVSADTNTSTFTTLSDGYYDKWIGGSGTGSSNTTFRVAIFTNGALNDCEFYRTIGTEGSIGNASDRDICWMPSNTTVSVKIMANTADAWLSFFGFHFILTKISN